MTLTSSEDNGTEEGRTVGRTEEGVADGAMEGRSVGMSGNVGNCSAVGDGVSAAPEGSLVVSGGVGN